MSRQIAPTGPQAPVGGYGRQEPAAYRFRMHRAGIRNVWQYDEQEFQFGDGRLLLRGKNGAGKSKALEMLLPYLLDGDARALDATGTGRTTLAWLMLDGFEQTNRLGYLWVEFRRTDESGAQRYLTLGAAIRASKSANTAKPFFFSTTRRVGEDLQLAEAGQPLPLDRLRASIGPENVLDRAEDHRTRVARELFGLTDSSRYRNLTQQLHRLRRPTIGDRIESGGLVAVLSETLPGLDEEVVEKVARNLDDLDSVRDDLGRLEKTDAALRHFLGGYRGYLHGLLRRRAADVSGELLLLAERRKAAGVAAKLVSDLRTAEAAAVASRDTMWGEQEDATSDLRTLEKSAGYRSLQELGERRGTVEALRTAAEAAFKALRGAHGAEVAAGAGLSAGALRTGTELRELGAWHRELRDAAEKSGLALAHLGDPATVPAITVGRASDEELTDPDGAGHQLRRELVTAFDAGAVVAALRSWDGQLAAAEPVVKTRLRTVGELSGLLAQARAAEESAREADTEYERLEAQAQSAAEQTELRRGAVLLAGDAYTAQVSAWADRLQTLAGEPLDAVRAVVAQDRSQAAFADRALPADVAEEVETAAHEALAGPLKRLSDQRDSTAALVPGLAATLETLRHDQAVWEQHTDPEPPRARHHEAVRAPFTGAPLYRVVDFADGLTDGEQSGLEAALEAGGLLDAWVTAEGTALDPLTRDTLLVPDTPTAPGPNLADVLHPVSTPGSGVTDRQIHQLLASVALVPEGSPLDGPSRSAVSPDGRWRLGVLQGAHRKTRAEYVGAEVRAATKRQRLAELAGRIAAAETELTTVQALLKTLTDHRDTLTAALRRAPKIHGLTDAWARLTEAERAGTALARATATAARAASEARTRSAQARRQAESLATAHALPVDPPALDLVREALRDLGSGTDRLRRRIRTVSESMAAHRTERTAYESARSGHADAAADYVRHSAALAAARREIRRLEETVGATAQQILAEEDAIRRRLATIADHLPKAEREVERLHDERVRAEQDEQARRTALGSQEEEVIRCGRALRTALATPEVVRGAGLTAHTAELTAPDPAHDDARARLKALHTLVDSLRGTLDPERRDISDTALLNRFNDLRDQLVGGYDAALEEPDGIKVCRLLDDTGQHDVALVGERIALQAADARSRLTERERDVFHRFLTGELGDNLSSQVLAAAALVEALNRTLRSVRTSHGLGVELDWRLADTVSADVRAAVELLRSPSGLRTREQSEQLREVLQRRIEDARRADPAAGYAAHLRTALDYRSWFTFQPWVVDDAAAVRRRKLSGRTGLSQGEQRVLSYLVLFAAAAAHFTTLAESAPQAPRLILLDDAFAKVDEPTHARLGRILVDLDLDFVLTSERLMGNWPDVPSLHIYECLRDPHHRGVATLHYTWNGRNRRLVSV